ncbi:DUF5131 family protein [Candidatus Nitrospira bockiana]
MGDRSAIEWTDSTWNPVTGCTRVSEGCRNCYMARVVPRQKQDPWTVVLHPERLEQPLHGKKPRRIFVNSLSDLFHEDVPFEFTDKVFAVMALCPQHTFQVLTKRPERLRAYSERIAAAPEILGCHVDPRDRKTITKVLHSWPLPNVWLGVSVENQRTADAWIPLLLQTPAAVRFLSCEPLLSGVDLKAYLPHKFNREPHCPWCEDCISVSGHASNWRETREDNHGPFLDWVIVGGESGPGARPMHPDWARSIRDQCQAAGVPFFFKQWGEWRPGYSHNPKQMAVSATPGVAGVNEIWMERVGKKAAGRVLDGRTWEEFPR